jgi:hypothetical protein
MLGKQYIHQAPTQPAVANEPAEDLPPAPVFAASGQLANKG